ncbi:MAG: bifunctional riboflavin kinase/FAD synthetase [Porticoccus sp.]|nr:bifunctional riboflavin kinase/FAD synthetase [Porticoccus sp.]MBQ0807691.1 bifunctional riboflavin kinase/FAD synthetase [Porticoccus sp.]
MSEDKKKFIRGLHNLKPEHGGCVATIGSFDGVHRGHRAILQQLREKAAELGLPSVVMIFEPQPQEFFSGEQAPARLMRLREKIETFVEEGVDQIFCLQFNRSLRSLSAREFVDQVLIAGLNVHCLVVGDDFRFGHDRSGNYQLLKQAGIEHGFDVLDTRTLEYQGERISSTRIRRALDDADFELVEALLGRPFRIAGRVVYGQRLGRQLGIPTANVHLNRYRAPLSGVYVVEAFLDGRCLPGVANVGVRPTVGDLIKPVLEVHLLDFDEELYGQRIHVEFKAKVREEAKFSSLDLMVEEIHNDIKIARKYFAEQINDAEEK